MNMRNNWQVIGRLGQNAEVKTTAKNKLLIFSVANDQSYKDQNGQKVEKVQWIKCVQAYPLDHAVKVADYLLKGSLISVVGKPYAKAFMNKEGQAVAQQSLSVKDIELLSPPK